ncbi:MAG TPA: symmetrical bis(5'-nucleosyl)-tetraphosphatase [Gammaproteobacteria bacterium]|nr:symmetrical bis(5'-nucleosyl)-tetraphosphatase [Gammaproteobacteria bacterium]
MSTYAIGDIQGCLDPLQKLLKKIAYNPAKDHLWFTGDLINRGPDSLETLEFIMGQGNNATVVLGNHDLHFLAIAEGHGKQSTEDNLGKLLGSAELPSYIKWLRHQPLIHCDAELGYCMIHAGLPPQWDLDQAIACAREVETILQGDDYGSFLANMYGNKPSVWSDELQGIDRLRFITNAFTRLRFCNAQGEMCLAAKGPPGTQPQGFLPWFQVSGRSSRDMNILFGHWSSLGCHHENNTFSLDSGCLWGQQLTTLRLDDMNYFSVECDTYRPIV